MVEEIEELRPELEPRCLRQPGIFQQSHIPVVQARPVKEPPPASQRSNRFRNKLRTIKEGRKDAAAARVQVMNRSTRKQRRIHADRQGAGIRGTQQGIVVRLIQRDRKTGGKSRNAA